MTFCQESGSRWFHPGFSIRVAQNIFTALLGGIGAVTNEVFRGEGSYLRLFARISDTYSRDPAETERRSGLETIFEIKKRPRNVQAGCPTKAGDGM